jgi:hypothetical protein
MNPPARSAPVTRGAIGSATASSSAHEMTIGQRRRAANRPSARERSAGRLPRLGGEGRRHAACMLSGRRRSGGRRGRRAGLALWYDPGDGSSHTRPHVQLFTIFFSRPVEFGLATALTVLMLVILVRSMFSAAGPRASAAS